MIRRIISTVLAALILLQTPVAFAHAWSFVFEDMAYENGVDEANGRVYYTIGKNDVSKKIKFSVDMGLIDAYIPTSTVECSELKKVLKFVFGTDSLYNRYFKNANEKRVLTVDEAVVAFMDAAGYGQYFELQKRTSKSAYVAEAEVRGLLDGVNYTSAKNKLTMEQFYTMFFNTLNLQIFEAHYSSSETSYNFTNRTLMNIDLKLTKIEGVVKANSFTSINGSPEAGEGSIKIANYVFDCKLKDADDYLGYKVDAYINKEREILSIAVDENSNNTLMLKDSDDIAASSDRRSIKYYDDKNKVRSINVQGMADFVYNHVAYPGIPASLFSIKNGFIRMIDNNGDKAYDVIMIYDYISFMPEAKYSTTYTITDKLGNVYDLSEVVDGKYYGMRNMNDEKIEFDDIIVSYGVTLLVQGGTNIVTEITTLDEKTYEGVYSQGNNGKDLPVKIGDRWFAVAETYKAEWKEVYKADWEERYKDGLKATYGDAWEAVYNRDWDDYSRDNWESAYKSEYEGRFPYALGSRVIVTLDPFDRIIDSANIDDSIKYGYVLGIGGENVFGQDLKIKMFTENSKMEILNFASKIQINGVSRKTDYILNGNVSELYTAAGGVKPQLVRYRVNAKGNIIALDIADTTSNKGLGMINKTDDFQLNYDGSIYYIGETSKTLGGKYRVDRSATKVFCIPNDLSREELFRITAESFYHWNTYKVKIYDVDDTYTSGAIVQEVGTYSDYMKEDGRFVLEVGQCIDEQTGDVRNYVGYSVGTNENTDYESPYNKVQTGEAVGGRFDQVAQLSDLRRGDIYSASKDYNGLTTRFRRNLCLDYTRPLAEQTFEKMYNDTSRGGIREDLFFGEDIHAFGKVVKTFDEGFIFNADNAGGFADKKWDRTIHIAENTDCRLYEYESDTASIIQFMEVQPGDFVYFEMFDGKMGKLVVYRP